MITETRLKTALRYDPISGNFTWLVNAGRCRIGDVAGRINNQGYVQIGLDRKHYLAHRLAWFYTYGEWPSPTGESCRSVQAVQP